MLTPAFARAKFELASPYGSYVASGAEHHRASWENVRQAASLTDAQKQVVGAFTRRINVLITSGLWCGDCAQQVPLLDAIAQANPASGLSVAKAAGSIDLRLLDRDEHKDLSDQVRICGGLRVPTVIFLSEDFEFVGIAGDKSLSRLRNLAAKSIGGAFCELPGMASPTGSLLADTTQDWVNEFERIHLLLRLSPKLRERHND